MNDTIKYALMQRAAEHYVADTVVQGDYYTDGKGCTVGCLAETDDNPHEVLSELTDIPEWVFRLADTIHEGLTEAQSKEWLLEFVDALPAGEVDWEKNRHKWTVFICDLVLENKSVWLWEDKMNRYARKVIAAIVAIRDYTVRALNGEVVDFDAAFSAAADAAYSARAAAAEPARDAAERAAYDRLRDALLDILRGES